jgi:hypothetical protein
MLEACLKIFEADGVPLLLIQLLDVLRVVFTDAIIAEVGCHNPYRSFAVNRGVVTTILVITYTVLVDVSNP